MNTFQHIEAIFLYFSSVVPLELYTFFGSFIEEAVSFVPSPLILTVAGSIAHQQEKGWLYLILLGVIGSIGKTLAGWFLYVVADKAEDIVIGKYGKWIGVSHQRIEAIGKKFGQGKRDDVVIFLLRAIPLFPSSVVSMACGAIRIDVRTYLTMSLLGNFIRDMLYLYLGYTGIQQASKIVNSINSSGIVILVCMLMGVIGVIGWGFYHRNKLKKY